MFLGFIDEAVAATLPIQIADANDAPVEPDAAPTFRIYGPNGLVTGGSGNLSSFESGVISGATNAAPIVLTTTAPHGLSTGQPVTIASVGGTTAANGNFLVTALTSTTFSLQGSTGNGVYTSGGTWKTTGLYAISVSGGLLASLQAGHTYTGTVTYKVSGAFRTRQFSFSVV